MLPALSVITKETTLPSARSVLPEMVGVVSLPNPLGSKVRVGEVVSMVPVALADALLPASSVAVAVTV